MKSWFKEYVMSVPMPKMEARTQSLGESISVRGKPTIKDFKGKVDPDWCPGCGDFGVLSALKQALSELGLYPHEVMVISGIGCSSNIPGYINAYGMHTLHGRALAVATGAQLANHTLKVIATGGDGDGYGIGGNHFVHSMRRNVDLTYIVMDNQIYGLTTGQISPTSVKDMKTKSTPFGSVENPINPIPLAIAAGATYVARGYTGQVKHLVDLIKGGIQHKGFALIDAFSPCVTYNHDNSHEFFKQRTRKLEDMGHDPTDFAAAMKQGYLWGEIIPIGLFWKRDDLPSLDQLEPVLADGGPLARRALGVAPEAAQALIRELM
jgi:2-oxoglutarate ferredoxin oxidoreductase subunit beta